MGLHGGANQAAVIDPSAQSRKPLPTRAYLFLAPHRCGRLGDVPGEWTDVCGFLKPPGSENEWQIRMQGAFTIPFDMLGIRHTELPPRSVGPPQCATARSRIAG